MSPALLAALGGLVAMTAGALSATQDAVRGWQVAAALTALVVGAGVWVQTADADGAMQLEARAGGAPAVTRVVVQPVGERRATYAIPLRRDIPAAPIALAAMMLVGLLGVWLGRRPGAAGRLAPAAAAVTGGVALAAFLAASGGAEGPEAVRAWLSAHLANVPIDRFTVPGPWRFSADAQAMACGGAAVAALPVLARGFGVQVAMRSMRAVGALGVLAATGWLIVSTGGPWFSPTEGALAAAAVLLGVALLIDDRPALAAALTGAGAGLALLG